METTPLSYRQVNRDLLKQVFSAPAKPWSILLACDLAVLAFGLYCWRYQLEAGLGVTGLNHPVSWGVYITNFVFWVGIAHSGTLISAVLFLFRAGWRTSIARSAEAMTIFAVMTAALFPIIHLGRAWNFYWLLPYPNQRQLWVNFQSPLVWDAFAISTYFAVSAMFWYIGLLPDLAAIRDRAGGLRRTLYGLLSLGWQGTNRQWLHYLSAYGFFAALATPLVVSVHSVVSWDFAMALVPGWHSTIFAPYFVAGAIFSGLAMVLTLLIPLRRIFGLEAYITPAHFDNLGKMIILTSLILSYAYVSEVFIAWYSGNPFERAIFWYRAFGDYSHLFWLMVCCNCLVPMLLWARSIRTHTLWLFGIALLINVGMWLERFVIIVSSLAHEFNPSAWGVYWPTWVEIGITAGSFAWFFLWFLLFIKFLPLVSLAEIKEHLPLPTDRPPTGPDRQAMAPALTGHGSGAVGIFSQLDSLLAAITHLRRRGYSQLSVVSPFPVAEIQRAFGASTSPVRYYTLAGGLLGACLGFGLPIYTALDWPLQTGGKPMIGLPSFAIIGFEMTILFGALATLLGLLLHARLPARPIAIGQDPRFSEDCFGLCVACTGAQLSAVKDSLTVSGAQDVYGRGV